MMNEEYFSISIIELDDNEEIINRCEYLNDLLMSIDITQNIHQQAANIGYGNIYDMKDIEKTIAYNIMKWG